MKAIIPAAGAGTRLQPHTFNRPKVMVPVAGKPILEHISESLFSAGINHISVIVGYKKEAVMDYFNTEFPGKFTFITQKEMKGLAHAVRYGLEDRDEPVLIILGDTIIDMDLRSFRDPGENRIAVVGVEDPQRFGIVETDKAGMILGMVEKPKNPPGNLAIAGVYYLQSQRKLKNAIDTLMRDNVRTRGEYQLTDALRIMMDGGEKFKALPIQAWYDCGTAETLLSTNRYLLKKHALNRGDCRNCILHEPLYIAAGSRIEDSEIGPGVAVGKNVLIRGSKIRNSMVFQEAILENCRLEDSLIGERSRIDGAAGTLNVGDDEAINIRSK
ncbi:MAG: sugar phosphate nucleotidyltransferase [Candidatus Neomarinimicrobiota bacterium]|jgi:glucose-1-phosphate thymidylyltransferase|nr:sugar phosphate nucleotidyltransferase [Candidatus Neomarinimicrobiota bacterium]MDD3966303.1 sugar phosphate nucleotidyltransferase [Candidatus Neomarinimicrobiota bacterium]MDX9779667.1 sugar phosphate nucleotidyltransferase [bacterium]